MEKYPVHNLASICQRMPLDVFVTVGTDGDVPRSIRVVKSDIARVLREMDGRLKVEAELTLNGIYITF